MCNLGEGLYENGYNQAIADEQARQAIETEKLLKKIDAEKAALDNKRIQALIAAGVDPDIVNKIMKSN